MKQPAFFFYTGDWLKDPNLSKCLPATRGIWADALAAMHENGRMGVLAGTCDQLSRILRCTPADVMAAADDLKATGTATVTIRNGIVTLINRRMKREAKEREQNRLRQQAHRLRQGSNGGIPKKSPPNVSISPSGNSPPDPPASGGSGRRRLTRLEKRRHDQGQCIKCGFYPAGACSCG